MLFLKRSLSMFIILLVLSPMIPISSATISDDFFGNYSFQYAEDTSVSTVINQYHNSDARTVVRIYFQDISLYQNDIKTLTSVVDNTSQISYIPSKFVHNGTLTIGVDVIGNYSYFGHSTGGDYVWLQMGIQDWDASAYSGYQQVVIGAGDDGQYARDFGDHTISSIRFNESTDWAFGTHSPSDYVLTNSLEKSNNINYLYSFYHYYSFVEEGDLTKFELDKNGYLSNISIYIDDSLWYKEGTQSSTNKSFEWVSSWLESQGSSITITAYGPLGDLYSTTHPFAGDPPEDDGIPNTLSGMVVNAVDNTLLDTVVISLNSTTGYGGDYQDTSSLGFYEITNIIDDNYDLSVDYMSFESYQRNLDVTENLELNIPLISTDQVTLGTNLSGVYGIVFDHYTEQPVSNVIVRIENNTYSDFTVTNQNGYYQFTNITSGNYTVEGNKVEYYPYQQKNLTTIVNDMLVHNFDMVLLLEPVDSVTDELEDALGLEEVTEEDILHFLKTYGFWLFMLALFFFMYAAYKSSGVDRWFK